ncbi:hypothetical protein KC315_g75 [Hortaea werneckii]|nr:hypothetical protein KC358_g415 [Hortaea werneckii]KAI6852579.1 hypothetical protein KC350_g759 [Hortaea werneckii]KAI6944960.1 hypothetical protein KC341_g439 [Hortaea werneckii]KAI6950155.1 hypothetical protein KC348_g854 [Hortaea werneckii]KAI6983282.1 hypothetical protein KC321_g180 [Hortaea werneckii]
MNTTKALLLRAVRLPNAASSGHQQLRHFTTSSPPSHRAPNHRRRGYTPPSSFPFPPEPLPAWFSKPPKLPHGVSPWEITLVLGLPVIIIGWLYHQGRPDDWEHPEKRVVRQKPEPLELFLRIRRPFFRARRPASPAARPVFRELPRYPSRETASSSTKTLPFADDTHAAVGSDERPGVSTPAIGQTVDDHGAQKIQQRHGDDRTRDNIRSQQKCLRTGMEPGMASEGSN